MNYFLTQWHTKVITNKPLCCFTTSPLKGRKFRYISRFSEVPEFYPPLGGQGGRLIRNADPFRGAGGQMRRGSILKCLLNFEFLVALNNITNFYVVEIMYVKSAFITTNNFFYIILESFK